MARASAGRVEALACDENGGFAALAATDDHRSGRPPRDRRRGRAATDRGLAGAIRRGIVRHCPTCDAYEVRDRRIAVLGAGTCRMQEAMLLRSYTQPDGAQPGAAAGDGRGRTGRAAVGGRHLVDEPVAELVAEAEGVCARLASSGRVIRFDTSTRHWGCAARSELATRLGAEHDEDGMLIVDDHQRTSVPGLYAVGDVVAGLTQIGVAMGQAAIAASTINSSLERRLRPASSRRKRLIGLAIRRNTARANSTYSAPRIRAYA